MYIIRYYIAIFVHKGYAVRRFGFWKYHWAVSLQRIQSPPATPHPFRGVRIGIGAPKHAIRSCKNAVLDSSPPKPKQET